MYIGSIGDAAQQKAAGLTAALREEGFYVECDAVGRSVKAQMKYADKLGAKFSCILGDNEIEAGKVRIKRMDKGEITEVALDQEALVQYIYHNTIDEIAEYE